MSEYDGVEPIDNQVRKTELPREDFDEFWHEKLILRIIRAEADPEGIYRGSTRRLALATGLPFHDIHVLLLLMDFKGMIEARGDGIVVKIGVKNMH